MQLSALLAELGVSRTTSTIHEEEFVDQRERQSAERAAERAACIVCVCTMLGGSKVQESSQLSALPGLCVRAMS